MTKEQHEVLVLKRGEASNSGGDGQYVTPVGRFGLRPDFRFSTPPELHYFGFEMSIVRPIADYSRQELYDVIWSTPASKLAADFGISDVAIAKRCKRVNVPRPSRGYWAKVAAGHKPRQTPLPPTPDEMFKQTMRRRIRKTLPLPGESEPLDPLAAELMDAIPKARLDSHKRTHLCERTLPEVTVSKPLAERAARAFHVILKVVESFGIPYRKSRTSYGGGYFERRYDRLYLSILEDCVRSDGSRVSEPWWQSPRGNEKLSGYLTFWLNTNRYGAPEKKCWAESAKLPLEKALAQIVATIREHFVKAQEHQERDAVQRAKDHADWLQRTREWERQEAIRVAKEKERKHADALLAAAQARKVDLLKAAENWRLNSILHEFIDVCETRLKSELGAPSAEHVAWVTWAREIAAEISPFSAGYPDPTIDGPFDPSLIPAGGPYPANRHFNCG